MEISKKKVVITGISGYIGSYVCKLFLEDGGFNVRGTVRDKNNEAKIAPLRKAFGNLYSKIELVEADLLKVESLSQAIKGCDYVVHIASPNLFKEPKDENLIIRPALEGTMAIL